MPSKLDSMSEDNPENISEDTDEIAVKHTYADGYQLVPSNGVDVGVQPQGEVKIDFTYDHSNRTEYELYDAETGQLSGMTFANNLEREHQVGVTMEPESAQDAAIHILSRVLGENVTRQQIIEGLREAVNGSDNS